MYLQLQLMVEVVQHRVYIAPRQVSVNQRKMCSIKSCLLYRTNRYMNERHQKLCVRCHILILLSEVEQEQRPSGNGDCEAIVVGAGLCDGVGGNRSKEQDRK